ncbi:hypothetical protein XELAEV_18020494mg [Xenopus laevis]|uniref:Uncharacterized protein n=1 Tax=Xenopus laevis TaxID=8355 RepID=A0A974D9S3_XENLA|nr:hypothetical protein XELAEV_18020494mg [Xenopus laevis]
MEIPSRTPLWHDWGPASNSFAMLHWQGRGRLYEQLEGSAKVVQTPIDLQLLGTAKK